MTEDVTKSIALYHNLFLACLVLFFICLSVAIVLFFVLHIADVIGYLTGRKARKQIEKLAAEDRRPELVMRQTAGHAEPEHAHMVKETEWLIPHEETGQSAGTFEVERELLMTHTEESI